VEIYGYCLLAVIKTYLVIVIQSQRRCLSRSVKQLQSRILQLETREQELLDILASKVLTVFG